MDELRTYKNTVILDFDKSGDAFSLNVPHHGKWISIIQYLRTRGFKVSENSGYKKHYEAISKFHKIAIKSTSKIVCLMEIGAARITLEFGHVKNLWGSQTSFWSNPDDDRYTHLTYLENLAIKLEITEYIDFCGNYYDRLVDADKVLSPEQYIINNLNKNKHIHGAVNSLEDIKISMQHKYNDVSSNTRDANNIKIICGQKKYFYDYNRRLCCGVVWHNINNMWWVISGGELKNIACFQLFNYNGEPFKKSLTKDQQIQALNSELTAAEKIHDYQRCITLWNLLKKYKLYNIWSIKHNLWWGKNDSGYTQDIKEAGVYTYENVTKNKNYYNNGVDSIAKEIINH